MAAVAGASAIPGAGPILGPVTAGLVGAGSGLEHGQGPLTSLAGGAVNAGMNAGMGQLGDWMQGPQNAGGGASQFMANPNMSLADPNMMNQMAGQDPLTKFAIDDLMKRTRMMGGRGF